MRTVKAVLSFSLALLLAASGRAEDYAKLAGRLNERNAREIAREVYYDPACPPHIRGQAKALLSSVELEPEALAGFRSSLQAASEADPARDIARDTRATAVAAQIKRDPAYRDAGVKADANWLDKAFERLKKLRFDPDPNVSLPQPKAPLLEGLQAVVWALLGAGVLFLLVWALRHFSWKRSLQRKAKAMLEEDEPERTVDEWLALADELEAAGRHREAVRCLYLACLLRFDEFGVARFDRSQTNWEHLRRIQASPKAPPGLRFEEPTRSFDAIWYGNQTAGPGDVAQFRRRYEEVLARLKEAAA